MFPLTTAISNLAEPVKQSMVPFVWLVRTLGQCGETEQTLALGSLSGVCYERRQAASFHGFTLLSLVAQAVVYL